MFVLSQILNILGEVFFFLGYISPSGTYPPKLPPSEEKRYVKMMREGDKEARNKLIIHNMRLVAHVVKKYSTCSIDTQDLLSIGTVGLIKGVDSFDPDKAPRLAGYVARCIDNEILMAIRSEAKMRENISLEDVIGTDEEGNNIRLQDIMASEDEDVASGIDTSVMLRRMYTLIDTVLDSREREIIILRYGLFDKKRHTQSEIAQIFGISRSYVSRIEKKALMKLADRMQR